MSSWTWWENGAISFEFGFLADGLSVMMLFVVTAISLLVHIYSTEYLEGDRRFGIGRRAAVSAIPFGPRT